MLCIYQKGFPLSVCIYESIEIPPRLSYLPVPLPVTLITVPSTFLRRCFLSEQLRQTRQHGQGRFAVSVGGVRRGPTGRGRGERTRREAGDLLHLLLSLLLTGDSCVQGIQCRLGGRG